MTSRRRCQIHRARTAARWIPVGERLPDDDRFVLILIDDCIEFSGCYTAEQTRWEWCDPNGVFHPAHKVTHWQESPPLPRKESTQ